MNSINKKTVIIVYSHDNADSAPSFMALLKWLSNYYLKIEIFSRNSDGLFVNKDNQEKISFSRPSIWNPFRHFERPFFLRWIIYVLRNIWLWRKNPSVLIAVDTEALVYLNGMNRLAKKNLTYLSFELMVRDELIEERRVIKDREALISRNVSLVIVQDKERFNVLMKENYFSSDAVVFLPNAPLPVPVQRSGFLREKFGISEEKRIVLCAGSIASWSARDFLEEMVSYWPNKYVLVINSRANPGPLMSKFLNKIQSSGRIFVTEAPSYGDQMIRLFASADYGLASYVPVPEGWATYSNVYHMGLSSGKVGYYAMCGLPIVASALPVYVSAFQEYKAGGTYKRLSEAADVLVNLDKNYDFHASEARRWYDEVLNPTRSLDSIVERIRGIQAGTNVIKP